MNHAENVIEACREIDNLCGDNAHLIEDPMIGRIVEFAANGRHTVLHRVANNNHALQSSARIVPAHPDTQGREIDGLDTEQHNAGVWLSVTCDRCDRDYRNTEARHLLVPAGTAAVEFRVCPICVNDLDATFAPVQWKESRRG